MIILDGSNGEGGGAILRQAMALSTITQKPFRMEKIRSGRPQPGLKAQHLHSIIALQKISNCQVTDCEVGSERITFVPGHVKSCNIEVDVGTAGSITLLLQSLLLPCIFSEKNVNLTIIGGTDVKWSQPIDYLTHVLIPYFKKYADIDVKVLSRGYYPKGQGKVKISIKSKTNIKDLEPLDLVERGPLLQIRGISHAAKELTNAEVADRQAQDVATLLSSFKVPVNIVRQYNQTASIGSGLTLWAIFARDHEELPIVIGVDSLGEKGKPAEKIGEEAALRLSEEIKSDGVIDRYLGDQLIPLLALTKGRIKVSKISNHAKSNIYVAENFLDGKFKIEKNIISTK